MFQLTIKELLAKKLRLLTTALAVMLGVAFMSGTLVFTDTIDRTFDGLLADAYSGTDAYVRGQSELDGSTGSTPRLDAAIVDSISGIDGVETAFGFTTGYAQIVDHDGKAVGNPGQGAPTFGESWITDDELNPYQLASGHAPSRDGEVVVDQHSADIADLVIGESIEVLTKAGPAQFTISGIARFGDADSAGGASAVLFTQHDAQTYVSAPGKVDAVLVRAADGVSQETVAASIAQHMPTEIEVLTGAEITKETQDDIAADMAFVSTFLLVFAGIALFVGAFIIFNTFSIIVTQRQREMALLRAIGASSKQVIRSVLVEASVVGAIASAAGLATGIGVAAGLKALLASFGLDLPGGSMAVTNSTIIVSLVVGTVVTLTSAFFPARKAGKIPPVAAMRSVAIDQTGSSKRRTVIGTVVTGLGVASMMGGLSEGELPLVGLGALVTFVGVAVLAPVLARPAARLLGWPVHRTTRMSGSLARQNAMRNPKRTASTAAALMIGVALVGFIATLASSTKQSINAAVDTDFDGDFVIDSGTFGVQSGLSHDLAEQIAARPEMATVTSNRAMDAELDGTTTFLQSWDATSMATMFDLDVQQGDLASLGADGIAVHDEYATSHDLTIGSPVTVDLAEGSTTLHVDAIYGDATWTGGAFIDHAVLDSLGADALDDAIYIRTADGVSPGTAQAILDEMTAGYPTADVLDKEGFKDLQSSNIDMFLNLIYALLALAIVIALMGIANTLALSIFERTRELGVLRALGMTRSQLKATVRWEAMIIALFGTAMGLAIGLFFGWSIVRALNGEGIDQLVIPVPTIAVVSVIAALAGIAASVLPARRAARLDVLAAIATQ
ncbi:MAG: ABC transporter permease [Ilumatobacteraceae bacterium]